MQKGLGIVVQGRVLAVILAATLSLGMPMNGFRVSGAHTACM